MIGLLYLGIAFTTVTVLGADAGPAPLSDLLALGLGEWARPVTTVVAVLLSVGAMNAYFAGTARLGAALARDGSLPAWLAHGLCTRRGPAPGAARGHGGQPGHARGDRRARGPAARARCSW